MNEVLMYLNYCERVRIYNGFHTQRLSESEVKVEASAPQHYVLMVSRPLQLI